MKNTLLALIALCSLPSLAQDLDCTLNYFGTPRVKVFVDLDRGEILAALAGEYIDDAHDDFQIRLKEQKGSVLTFTTENPEYNPNDFSIVLDKKRLSIKANLNHKGFLIKLVGKCIRI